MDTVQALDFTIDRLDEIGHLFGTDAQQVADALRRIGTLGQPERDAYAASTALGFILNVATVHRDECDQFGCLTCIAIRDGLAANLANLRSLRTDAISRRLDAAPSPS